MRTLIQVIDFTGTPSDLRIPIKLLEGYCAELGGEFLSAKDQYASVIASAPRSRCAIEAAIRLRELERLEKEGLSREKFNERMVQDRDSPRYRLHLPAKSRSIPLYHPGARAAGVEGWVEVDFAISKAGAVIDPIVVASHPPFLFDGYALNALRNWSYPPPEEPIRSVVRLNFAMEPEPPLPSARVAPTTEASQLTPIEKRGREIFELDLASDRAGDAVLRAGYFTSLWNWIVVPQENRLLVRYIDDDDRVFADVLVDVSSPDLEQVTAYDPPIALPPEQVQMWRARDAAFATARNQSVPRCGETFSSVVLRSLEPNRSWDVYILPVSRDPRVVPTGGHHRIAVSSDPTVDPNVHAFADCARLKPASDSETLIVKETTSKNPTEIHVFMNLRYGYPLTVVTSDSENGLWFVRNGKVTRSNDAPSAARSKASTQ